MCGCEEGVGGWAGAWRSHEVRTLSAILWFFLLLVSSHQRPTPLCTQAYSRNEDDDHDDNDDDACMGIHMS